MHLAFVTVLHFAETVEPRYIIFGCTSRQKNIPRVRKITCVITYYDELQAERGFYLYPTIVCPQI